MQRRRKLLAAGLGVTAAVSLAVGGAFAATSAPKVDHLVIRSGTHVNPGHWIRDDLRYTPFASSVRSGGTISIKGDKGAYGEGPHTFSLVRKSQLPQTPKEINNCAVCGKIAQAHGADPNSQEPPPNPFVDGGDGFNKPGDSVYFEKNPAPLKVTAKKGKTLYYLCAIHPWMQGKVVVK